MKFNIIDDIVPKKATDNMSYNHLNRLLDLAEQRVRKKLGNPNTNTEAVFTFRNGKTATVKQFAEKPHFELIFENQTIFHDNQQRMVAYDLLVLGYNNQ